MSTALEQRQEPLLQVVITGDLRLSVTESEAAHGPITGHYSIEPQQMQGPLQVYWGAEGQVCNRQARATDIAFDRTAWVGKYCRYNCAERESLTHLAAMARGYSGAS